MKPLPPAIYNELVDGLTLLINARLAFAPRTEQAIDETLHAWEVVLASRVSWEVKTDAGRVLKAFIEMSGKLDKFPAPKALFEYLPPRPLPPPLPEPKGEPIPEALAQEIEQLLNKVNINEEQKHTRR